MVWGCAASGTHVATLLKIIDVSRPLQREKGSGKILTELAQVNWNLRADDPGLR
jgi:hypothetical protein